MMPAPRIVLRFICFLMSVPRRFNAHIFHLPQNYLVVKLTPLCLIPWLQIFLTPGQDAVKRESDYIVVGA